MDQFLKMAKDIATALWNWAQGKALSLLEPLPDWLHPIVLYFLIPLLIFAALVGLWKAAKELWGAADGIRRFVTRADPKKSAERLAAETAAEEARLAREETQQARQDLNGLRDLSVRPEMSLVISVCCDSLVCVEANEETQHVD